MSKNIQRIFLLVIVLAALGFGLWQLNQSPEIADIAGEDFEQEAVEIATVVFDFAPGDVRRFENVEFVVGESLLAISERVALGSALSFETKDFGAMGKLVTRIGQKSNGDGKAFWQFWVNGDYATVGASGYQVKGGDVIEWKFTNERE